VKHLELTPRQARALATHPLIETVEENAAVYTLGTQSTQSAQAAQTVTVQDDIRPSQTIPYGLENVQALDAHQNGVTGEGINVAILDTGIDRTHSDLSANVAGGFSVFTDSANSDPYNDGNGHGTHVAGTVAAANNGDGVLGVAYDANLYAVKVLNNAGGGSLAGVAEGIEWSIENDMDIINMSLGALTGSIILEEYADLANEAGILVIAAAGNSGNSFGTGDNVNYPAVYDSVLAVAATDQNNDRGSFSSTGPTVEISAPGVNVLSTVPNNGHQTFSGTSMAAPHVAGVAAIVWGAKPELSNEELRQVLNETALDLGTPAHYGNGLVQAMDAINQ
jgi:subtilisin